MPEGFTATVVLLPGHTALAVTLLTEPWRYVCELTGEQAVDWSLTTWSGEPVDSADGASMAVVGPAKSVGAKADMVVLVGGDSLVRAPEKPMITWLKKLAEGDAMIAGVGAGADVLERADLMHAGGGSVPMTAANAFRERHIGPALAHGLYTILGRRAVCAGGLAALDFSLAAIAHFLGEALAEGAGQSLSYRRRPSELELLIPDRLLRQADPRLVTAVQRLSALLVGNANSVRAAADASGLSERQLLRLFQEAFGMPPRRFQESLRLERARTLLRETDMTVLTIALAVGFAGGPELSRAFQRQYTESPTAYRARSQARVGDPAPNRPANAVSFTAVAVEGAAAK